jgi:hypothetical protein
LTIHIHKVAGINPFVLKGLVVPVSYQTPAVSLIFKTGKILTMRKTKGTKKGKDMLPCTTRIFRYCQPVRNDDGKIVTVKYIKTYNMHRNIHRN